MAPKLEKNGFCTQEKSVKSAIVYTVLSRENYMRKKDKHLQVED